MGKYIFIALDFVAVLGLVVFGVWAVFVEMRSVLGAPPRR